MANTETAFVRKNLTVSHSERLTLLSRIKANCRRYARSASDYRQQTVRFGNDAGVCFVSIGETHVYARTTITARTPDIARPKRGFVQYEINFDRNTEKLLLEDLSLADVRQGIRRALGSIIGSQAIDTDTLCISSGKLVWHVLTQINVLNYDGNVTDAALLCTMGALMHARHPVAKVEAGGLVRVLSEREHPLARLHIFHVPISSTYSVFQSMTASAKVATSDKFLPPQTEMLIAVDADARETLVADGSITIVSNKYGQVCSLFTMGCATVAAQDNFLENLCSATTRRAVELHDLLRRKADESHDRMSKWRIDFYKGINKTMLPDEPEPLDESNDDIVKMEPTTNGSTQEAFSPREAANLPYSISGPRNLLLKLIAQKTSAGKNSGSKRPFKNKIEVDDADVQMQPKNYWNLDAMTESEAKGEIDDRQNFGAKDEPSLLSNGTASSSEDDEEEDDSESNSSMEDENHIKTEYDA